MATILSVSVPADLRAALDAEAKRQRRSRSFVVSEAIRAYVVSREREAFTAGRDETLREALALSPRSVSGKPRSCGRSLRGRTSLVSRGPRRSIRSPSMSSGGSR